MGLLPRPSSLDFSGSRAHTDCSSARSIARSVNGSVEGASGMVTIFKHHISMWSLVEIVADLALCFLAVVLAVDRLPLSFDGQPLPHSSPVDLSVAVAFAFFMAL